MESEKIAQKIVELLDGKKARDISLINIKNISILADYFIICSGTSTTHIRALTDEIDEKLSEIGYGYLHKEGYNSARWVLLDYGEIVIHIFHEEDREFYNLDRLWSDGIVVYK